MLSKHKPALGLSALALASGLALAGCSDSTSSGSSGSDMGGMNHGSAPMATASAPSSAPASAGAFNDADVMFAQMMIPHHQQAVEMSDTVLAKSGVDGRVSALAQKIKAAQQPEIGQLTSWLSAWGKPAPSSSMSMSGMGGGDGMMSGDDMAKLQSADGATASKLFLSQMIAHHEGAVAMAKTEITGGSDTRAVALARSIVDSQSAEIAEMKALLASL